MCSKPPTHLTFAATRGAENFRIVTEWRGYEFMIMIYDLQTNNYCLKLDRIYGKRNAQ